MKTKFYSSTDRSLTRWEDDSQKGSEKPVQAIFEERSTVAAARHWAGSHPETKVGVLNFASAKKRGGGFKSGAQAQEESIARASNLYESLIAEESNAFYETHLKDDNKGFYSHSMIYTENVTLIRNEREEWAPPVLVNVVTSAAVNAGSARNKFEARRANDATILEQRIQAAMFDRMGRILKLFEDRKDKVLILGSFGTGASPVICLEDWS